MYPFTGHNTRASDAPMSWHRTLPSVRRLDDTTCPLGLNVVHQISLATVKTHSIKFIPDALVLLIGRTTRSVRCGPVSSPSSEMRIGRVRRITIGRATAFGALQLFCHVPRQQAPDAKQCSANVRCKTVGRAGAASQLRST
jgi:hypothetical protein